jgi:hypothetical protein
MPEPGVVVRDALAIIFEAFDLIDERMEDIRHADDFVRTKDGRLLADGIMMRLQIVSQKIDRIQQVAPELLQEAGIDPRSTIPTPILLELHYDELDYELLYDFCRRVLPEIRERLEGLRRG